MSIPALGTLALLVAATTPLSGQGQRTVDHDHFELVDVFGLEYASDPRISPDGERIVYVRNFMDIMQDRVRSNLWIVDFDGSDHRPLTTGNRNDSSPRWSPDGGRLLYVSDADGSAQLYLRWMDTGQVARLTDLTRAPRDPAWSPDGKWIAFSMLVPENPEPFVSLPGKPAGAGWAAPAKVIRKLEYRADGSGYLEDSYRQLFVISAEGGTARQVTAGPFDHSGSPAWTPDGSGLVFSANRHADWERDPSNTEIYRVSLEDGAVVPLTDRRGPDHSPAVGPDGRIAWLGYDDRLLGYQVTRLYTMGPDGGSRRLVTAGFDRDVVGPTWTRSTGHLMIQYDDHGRTKVARVALRDGVVEDLVDDVGGVSLGRPYASGSFTASSDGRYAYTRTDPWTPADVASGKDGSSRRVTSLSHDLFGHKQLGEVEEIRYASSFDQRQIQGWLVKPPDFDPDKKYPLILEIHGGPFANYGFRFSAEIQLYAAAGYVVLYANPRGSTSYGAEFGNLIHHNYPGEDYDDLMSGVDVAVARGFVDENQLFVTGGSGGGVLSSWIIGRTSRFRAAVVAKPVINWYSFVLTADSYAFFYKYWFPGFPWDHAEHYMRRSPISLVGNVETPTMLLTGEADYRTPISESEQYYQALQLRGVESALVRIPEASHGITARPSNMMAKVAHVLKWFEKYRASGN